MATGNCEHGEFDLGKGCPECMKEGGVIKTNIVKVSFFNSDKAYTYFSEDPLQVDDTVMVPVRGTATKGVVIAINVPEAEIASFKDKVKTIPVGSVLQGEGDVAKLASAKERAPHIVEDTELFLKGADPNVNLCDTCTLRKDYPICCAPDIEFGNGKGNDNIIQCSKYVNGPAAPCTIPLNEEIRPTEDAEVNSEENIAKRVEAVQPKEEGGAEIIILCNGGCGRTTESIDQNIAFGDSAAGKFEQIDGSGVPIWTCPDCLAKQKPSGKPLVVTESLLEETAGPVVAVSEKAHEITAIINVDPGATPSFAKHLEAARRVLEIAKSCEIRTEADAKSVNDDLNVMAELEKATDAERKTFTVPLNGYLSSINGEYKLITDPLTEAKQIYRRLLTAYKVEQQRKAAAAEKLNQEAIDLARRQAEANNGEFTVETKPVPVPFAPKLTRTDQGSSGLVDAWKYEVVDLDKIPREFMIPDHDMLSSIATKQHNKRPVQGVRFYNEPTLRSYRK